MKTRSAIMMLVGVITLMTGYSHGLAQDVPWADWQLERDEHNGDATYSPDLADEEAPLIRTVLTKDSGQSGDPYTDLQDALALLWLDMNEVEAVDVSQPNRLVVWGDVDSEHGERRFAAVLEPSNEGPLVTAFVATAEDFEAMGGPAFVGGNPEAAQSLERAQESGALESGTFETGEASEASTDETSPDKANDANETSEEASGDAPAIAEASDNASVPVPVVEEKEDGTTHIPGWEKDGQKGFVPWPGDASSPRLQFLIFEVDEVPDPEGAAAYAIKEIGLSEVESTDPRQIPSYAQIGGYEGYIVFGTGRAGGEAQNFALLVTKSDEDGHFVTRLLHAPPELYASWGGIIAPLTTFGLLLDDLRGAFEDPELRRQMRKASLDEQSDAFVQVAEINIEYLVQMAMMSMMQAQQNTLGMMQQMNSNLSTETSCILTPGCQIEYDYNGDAQMTQP